MCLSLIRVVLLVVFTILVVRSSAATEPLHQQIDSLIEARANGLPLALPASESVFMRRVYLDFSGRIPSVVEARTFLDDKSPDKRIQLIDRLLRSPEYATHMATLFHSVTMEQRGDNIDWPQCELAS